MTDAGLQSPASEQRGIASTWRRIPVSGVSRSRGHRGWKPSPGRSLRNTRTGVRTPTCGVLVRGWALMRRDILNRLPSREVVGRAAGAVPCGPLCETAPTGD